MSEIHLGFKEGNICSKKIEVINSYLTIKDTGMGSIGFWTKDDKQGHLVIDYTDISNVIEILQHILKDICNG